MTRIDDTLDVWAAHGMGGLVGALLTGVFAEKAINPAGNNGLLFGNPGQLWTQFIAVVASLTYSFVLTFVILYVMKLVSGPLGLRVSEADEDQGLDVAVHGEEGYRL